MNHRNAAELRVAALIRAYADRAPIEVDPMAMARLAGAGSRHPARVWFGVVPAGRGLAFALLLAALVVAMVGGALVAGGRLVSGDPEDVLIERAFVEPFIGLPPEGTAPSSPEAGELVLSFGGRVRSLGLDFHRMWLYADGRLIWKSNLEGSSAGWRLRFGASEPTTAVIEQRLTPEGVELLRSAAIAAGLHDRQPLGHADDPTDWGRPGVLWGGLVMRDGGRLVQAEWSDPALPGRLAVPASWLPASAWEDPRIGAYVPSRYAVCLQHIAPDGLPRITPAGIWDLVPEPTKNLIRSRAIGGPVPDWNERDSRCLYEVSTADARAVTAALDDAGLTDGIPIDDPSGLGEGVVGEGVIQILVILPNGEVVCNCG